MRAQSDGARAIQDIDSEFHVSMNAEGNNQLRDYRSRLNYSGNLLFGYCARRFIVETRIFFGVLLIREIMMKK